MLTPNTDWMNHRPVSCSPIMNSNWCIHQMQKTICRKRVYHLLVVVCQFDDLTFEGHFKNRIWFIAKTTRALSLQRAFSWAFNLPETKWQFKFQSFWSATSMKKRKQIQIDSWEWKIRWIVFRFVCTANECSLTKEEKKKFIIAWWSHKCQAIE